MFKILVSRKDYQLPPVHLLAQHKIYRKPSLQYNYISQEQDTPDKWQTTTDNQKVKVAGRIRAKHLSFRRRFASLQAELLAIIKQTL